MSPEMKRRFRTGGLAAWSIRRPISVLMLSLTVVVLGLFALQQLRIDLLPQIIYPDVRVRIIDPGVPVRIMEDKITRQLEEQLAITEGAIAVQSETSEGRSSVDLSFPYGTDIDIALRDASTRLDRAKRFLPTTIDPPIIYKRDPSQIPVMEIAVSATERSVVQLRDWVDYELSRWFINLPGVAAAEVGGGQLREIHIIADQNRLASFGLDLSALAERIRRENLEAPGGRLVTGDRELSTRALGRFQSLGQIAQLPLWQDTVGARNGIVRLRDVARVMDSHEEERLRIRLNGDPGIKLSIQKQPYANTVAVVNAVNDRLDWLRDQRLIPADVKLSVVDDQSVFIRHALRNAAIAAISGALLAMIVVYVFLGDLRRTLIIGTAIPLAIVVTFILMALGGLTLNIMTLGGLALGVGMLIDSTIVMLENITRHQNRGEAGDEAAINAASEITSAIVASTSTNLVAILPFLFIGGLIGLLFSELIFTLTAAIVGALVVAITVVPALGAQLARGTQRTLPPLQQRIEAIMAVLQRAHRAVLQRVLRAPLAVFGVLLVPTLLSAGYLLNSKPIFLPKLDQGRVQIRLHGEAGIRFDAMDRVVREVESFLQAQPEVDSVFTTSGGYVFGRSEYESSNVARIDVQLRRGQRSEPWIETMENRVKSLNLIDKKIRMRVRSVRGFRFNRGDDDISIRVQGPDIDVLTDVGKTIVRRLKGIEGLRNLSHTYEDTSEELNVRIDRERAADLGVSVEDIGEALKVALEGEVVSTFIDGDREYAIRLRLPRAMINAPDELKQILVGLHGGQAIYLRDVADTALALSPSTIKRDQQRRIVEISASVMHDANLSTVVDRVYRQLADVKAALPEGYTLYDGGSTEALKEGQQMGYLLIGLAIFLVFVVMAVQYESLRNPLVILLSIPFALIGVVMGLIVTQTEVSMPVFLGLIMLTGIVVNNAIVLVEQIEIEREKGQSLVPAILEAARLRLRPILMTSLTTVVGMLPLALGIGEGSEMLQPLAVTIVWGLSLSMLISLILVPGVYRLFHRDAA
jgi:CzcA family heavy metal efflux pump